MSLPKQIVNTPIVLIILLFVLFCPDYFKQNALLDMIVNGLRIAGSFVVMWLYFTDIKVHIRKKFNLALVFLCGALFVSTLLSNEASLYFFITEILITILIPVMLMEEIFLNSAFRGLRCMYIYFSACVLINTITVFLFPNAMYSNIVGINVCWFLGEDNFSYPYYIFASTIAMLHDRYINRKTTITSILVYFCSFIFVFYNNIATGIVCQILWIALVLGYQSKWIRKMMNAKKALYVVVLGFIFLILTRDFIFAPITEALGRDITLTGRTLVWDRVFEAVCNKPFLGYGVVGGQAFRAMLSLRVLTAHNYFLYILFLGGSVSGVLFCISFYFSNRAAVSAKNSVCYRCIALGLIVMSVRFLAEAGNVSFFYLLLCMLAYTPEFVRAFENRRTSSGYRIVISGRVPRIRLVLGGRKI